MAMYEMQEMTLPNDEGKRVLYPRMRLIGRLTLDDVAQRIGHHSSFSPAEVKGVMEAVTTEIARGMAEGYAVKIDGLGTFTPALGLRRGAERETGDEGSSRRNARSLCVSGVHFRADKPLVKRTGSWCQLERSEAKFRRSSQRYTPQERLALAQTYLQTHPFLTVGLYEALTGLRHATAARELRRWCEDEETGIRREGWGSHRVYVRRE